MKIRYHDARGRERWAAAGEIIPAGCYIENGQKRIEKPHIANREKDEGNPYDQGARASYFIFWQEM